MYPSFIPLPHSSHKNILRGWNRRLWAAQLAPLKGPVSRLLSSETPSPQLQHQVLKGVKHFPTVNSVWLMRLHSDGKREAGALQFLVSFQSWRVRILTPVSLARTSCMCGDNIYLDKFYSWQGLTCQGYDRRPFHRVNKEYGAKLNYVGQQVLNWDRHQDEMGQWCFLKGGERMRRPPLRQGRLRSVLWLCSE